MTKKEKIMFALCHGAMGIWLATVLLTTKSHSHVAEPYALLFAGLLIEALFCFSLRKKKKAAQMTDGTFLITLFVWIVLIAWELYTSVSALAHPVLVPCPENVFRALFTQRSEMLLNIRYSMGLLSVGWGSGMLLSILLGLVVSQSKTLREFACPLAGVLSPIPATVFSPYLVALMPTFRSASLMVIFLGVFWPNFLSTINRVSALDRQLLESARMMEPGFFTMTFQILLPAIFPGIIQGLKVSVTTCLLSLNYAETMGAHHGLGYYIANSITYANYTQAVAGIIVIGVVVTLLIHLVEWVQKVAVPWQREEQK